jgi:hypothetical protein
MKASLNFEAEGPSTQEVEASMSVDSGWESVYAL